MGEEALVERMRRRGGLVLPLASVLAVAAVAAVVAVLTMSHRDIIDATGQKHLDVGGYTFRYPATWYKIKAGDHKHPAEAVVPSVFLASLPMRANWTRTSDGLACDAEGYQVANELNRFAIGDRDPLRFNPDGSLDIYAQHANPGPDRQANWLPAPTGPLGITMRMYAPRPPALDRTWNPAPVRAVADP